MKQGAKAGMHSDVTRTRSDQYHSQLESEDQDARESVFVKKLYLYI